MASNDTNPLETPGAAAAGISVTLFFRTANDDSVYVSGDFNDWQPQEMIYVGSGQYKHTLSLLEGTRTIRFKYRVGKSTWLHDEGVGVEPDGFGGFNNCLDIEDYAHEHHDPMTETVVWNSSALRPSSILSVESSDSIDTTEADETQSISDYLSISGSEFELISLHSDMDDGDYLAMSDYSA